jgi:hypothetical protein
MADLDTGLGTPASTATTATAVPATAAVMTTMIPTR